MTRHRWLSECREQGLPESAQGAVDSPATASWNDHGVANRGAVDHGHFRVAPHVRGRLFDKPHDVGVDIFVAAPQLLGPSDTRGLAQERDTAVGSPQTRQIPW